MSAAASRRPASSPNRLTRWLISAGLVLAGCTGYGCAVSCNRLKPPPEPAGLLVRTPAAGQPAG